MSDVRDWPGPEKYRVVWQEDGFATGAESIREAWRRLFGEPLDLARAVAVIDGAAATARFMPGGRVAVTSYYGNADIRVVKSPPGDAV